VLKSVCVHLTRILHDLRDPLAYPRVMAKKKDMQFGRTLRHVCVCIYIQKKKPILKTFSKKKEDKKKKKKKVCVGGVER
jgi:hypothetical protein